jgi:transcriptional regulator with XRE-family HTH domain
MQGENIPKSIISTVIKKVMEEKGVTQQELAVASGCSQPDISRYLHGREPTLKNLSKIATALGMTVDEIMNASVSPLLTAKVTPVVHEDSPNYGVNWRQRAEKAEKELKELKERLKKLAGE